MQEKDFIIINNTSDLLSIIAVLIGFLTLIYIICIYNFNNYYTKKHKNDFLYLFWGYIDKENKVSAKDHLSLIIYHFLTIYNINSIKFFNKIYECFPRNIEDISPHSLMPNATKDNVEAFVNKHSKWMRFNRLNLYFLYFITFIIFILFYISEKL